MVCHQKRICRPRFEFDDWNNRVCYLFLFKDMRICRDEFLERFIGKLGWQQRRPRLYEPLIDLLPIIWLWYDSTMRILVSMRIDTVICLCTFRGSCSRCGRCFRSGGRRSLSASGPGLALARAHKLAYERGSGGCGY